MALSIPAGYGESVGTGGPAVVQVVADGSDANSTNVAVGYAGTLVAAYGRELAAERGLAPPEPRIGADVRVWFNPELESRDFMVPGILALLLLAVTTNLSSMAIVREREIGTLEQLNVTPLARWELIAGKLLPYAVLGMLNVMLVVTVAVLWFEVPFRGSVGLLMLMSLVYLMTTLGIGLFVSTISDTQQQAMITSSFFFLLPMVFLSGFIFPIENMPAAIQSVTWLVPVRYFLVILRGIFLNSPWRKSPLHSSGDASRLTALLLGQICPIFSLVAPCQAGASPLSVRRGVSPRAVKGIGLEVLWPQALALLAWGVGILTLATLRSSKRLA